MTPSVPVKKQQSLGWGDAVVAMLARDLQESFPGMRGFSVQNLWRMQQLYLTHTAPEFLSQVVRALGGAEDPEKLSQAVREWVAAVPWGHHANLLARLADPAGHRYVPCSNRSDHADCALTPRTRQLGRP